MTDPKEQAWRAVWRRRTPAERRALQALDGTVAGLAVPDLTEDLDGLPLAVGYTADGDPAVIIPLPGFLMTWNPDDDDPTTDDDDDVREL
jgi:hypothetical protein